MEFTLSHTPAARGVIYRLIGTFALLSLTQMSYAVGPCYQLRAYGGLSYPSFNVSDLTLTSELGTETDTLHSESQGNDFTAGVGIAYNFLASSSNESVESYSLYDALLGLDFFYLDTNDNGIVYQFGNPALDNFDYDLKFRTTRLMLRGELGFHPFAQDFIPFVQASAGVARISTSYDENPRTSEGITDGDISLSNNLEYNFVYSLGLGIRLILDTNMQVFAEYVFTDFGSVDTSTQATNNITLTHPLTTNLRTNTGMVGLSYTFA